MPIMLLLTPLWNAVKGVLGNKWVILALLVVAALWYTISLNNSLVEARMNASEYQQQASDLTKLLELERRSTESLLQTNKELGAVKDKVEVVTVEKIKVITKLEKVYVQNESNGECTLSSDVVRVLKESSDNAIQSYSTSE